MTTPLEALRARRTEIGASLASESGRDVPNLASYRLFFRLRAAVDGEISRLEAEAAAALERA